MDVCSCSRTEELFRKVTMQDRIFLILLIAWLVVSLLRLGTNVEAKKLAAENKKLQEKRLEIEKERLILTVCKNGGVYVQEKKIVLCYLNQ